MNVLIVSENFLNGGLETQVNSTVQSLKGKVNFFFALGNYNKKWDFQNVYTDFYFSYSSTVSEFCHDVDTLIQIIKENNIDVVHAHPFYSVFPAVFAAKICGKPVVYTYHGLGSYNFTYNINGTLLFNMLADYEIDKIFCVSMQGKKIFENCILEKDKILFLPNSINSKEFIPAQISNNKSWALISRLDIDKIKEIKKIINVLDEIDINELHIFGDGSEKHFLEQYILENQLTNKVFLEGHCDNLPKKLNGNFNGLIGIGRVAMEAISMEYPTILIGFNKIAGLIDSNIYNFIKTRNFSNMYLSDVSVDALKKQISQVYNNSYDKSFYKLFKQDFSTETISNLYIKELDSINYSSLLNLNELFDEIKKLDNNDIFYSSSFVYQLIKNSLTFYVRQPHQKDLFLLGDAILIQSNYYNKMLNENNQFNNLLESINTKFMEHEQKLNNLSENSMTYENFKRKLKYKFNKK